MNITLNIGLNNNPLNEVQIMIALSTCFRFENITYTIHTGQYNGEPEPTMIVKATRNYRDVEFLARAVKKLCELTTQECIPFVTEEESDLIYAPSYTGERFEFDSQYFIY